MKKAIAYTRISTTDQSNFSLSWQENYIRDFAAKNDYEIIAFFQDDGQSAKNFDRPDWKKLEAFCRENHHNINALIITKFDRFSRDLEKAMGMITKLEGKYKILILSAMEPIGLPPESPYYFQFRAQMLMGAQLEWMIIKDRTKAGINTAQKAGRYICSAPFGYVNKRDEQNKPIIVVDPVKAMVVRRMYQMFLEGASLKEISLEARRNGYRNSGRSAIKYTLTSPTYAGLIKVGAYMSQPEYMVKGIHEPIVSEKDWRRVQEIFNSQNKMNRTVMNEDVPLRAVLRCHCGSLMTAGKSKGKKRYFWYYKCNKHPKINLSAIRMHSQLDEVWKNLSLPEHYITYLHEKITALIEQSRSKQEQILADKKRELFGWQRRLDNVEEKFINSDLEIEAYKKWKARYMEEISIIRGDIQSLSRPMDQFARMFRDNLHKLGNMQFHYQSADLHTKQAILRQVFNSQLYYQEGLYRTPFLLPVFHVKASLLKEKGLLVYEQPLSDTTDMLECAPILPSVEHLTPVFNLLKTLLTA